jgi:hypothetical protein
MDHLRLVRDWHRLRVPLIIITVDGQTLSGDSDLDTATLGQMPAQP